jgi:hypothetical protein
MELLNHFVAARLMKDAQLFERIGRHGATTPLLSRPRDPALPVADFAAEMPEGDAPESPHSARDDRRIVPAAECTHDSRYP